MGRLHGGICNRNSGTWRLHWKVLQKDCGARLRHDEKGRVRWFPPAAFLR